MRIKPDCEASTDDFWYDLCEGYLNPEEILEDDEDIVAVMEALSVLKEFRDKCEDKIEGFIR